MSISKAEHIQDLMSKASSNGPQADKARSMIVTYWLNDNYKACEGVSIPRSDLYDHYCEYCRRNNMSHVNSASFGKLIRTVFPNLKTRRLGTRGKSKYHYCGLKIRLNCVDSSYIPATIREKSQSAPPSPNRISSDFFGKSSSSETGSIDSRQDFSNGNDKAYGSNSYEDYIDIMGDAGDTPINRESKMLFKPNTNIRELEIKIENKHNSSVSNMDSHLNTPLTPSADSADASLISSFSNTPLNSHDFITPNSSPLTPVLNSNNQEPQNAKSFLAKCKTHNIEVAKLVEEREFSSIENCLKDFWTNMSKLSLDERIKQDSVIETALKYDAVLYDTILKTLVPNIMQPIPLDRINDISDFSDSYIEWLEDALIDLPEEISNDKIHIANIFTEQLSRHTSLNKLVQIAGATLNDPKQRKQLLSDWEKIRFRNITEQVSWVSGSLSYEGKALRNIFDEIKYMLNIGAGMDSWINWLDALIERFVDVDLDLNHYTRQARAFLLKWEFYGSMAARDLTIRNSDSFGSFHVVRQMFGEYLFYIIEKRISLGYLYEENHLKMDVEE